MIGGHTCHVEPVGLEFRGDAMVENRASDLIAKRETTKRAQGIEIDFIAGKINGKIGRLAVGAPLQLTFQ